VNGCHEKVSATLAKHPQKIMELMERFWPRQYRAAVSQAQGKRPQSTP
jgi:hypothetical protein